MSRFSEAREYLASTHPNEFILSSRNQRMDSRSVLAYELRFTGIVIDKYFYPAYVMLTSDGGSLAIDCVTKIEVDKDSDPRSAFLKITSGGGKTRAPERKYIVAVA